MKKIGILLFDDVELLDFAGPLQVFSTLQYVDEEAGYSTVTIGMTKQVRVSKSNLIVDSDFSIEDFDQDLDLVVIPGGYGTRPLIKDDVSLTQIDRLISRSKKSATVCTGSLILARLGHLKNMKATTHYLALDLMHELDPTIDIDRSQRYHDNDNIIISEGVSAGIDMSLYLIETRINKKTADTVRKYIEYYPEPYERPH